MKGMTVTLLGVVAFGLLFVGSRAEGETTAPSVPDVPPADSPGGDSKGPAAGQGGASQTKPEADAKVGQGYLPGGGNVKCWECIACGSDQGSWTQRTNCAYCEKTQGKARNGEVTVRACVPSGKPHDGCRTLEAGGETGEYCTCATDLCNASSVPCLAGFLALLSAVAVLWNRF